jgi:hypothetical protein
MAKAVQPAQGLGRWEIDLLNHLGITLDASVQT